MAEMNGKDLSSDQPLTITLYGTARGKVLAAIAHAYFLASCKLSLAPATDSAPWRIEGKQQDYFQWRKAITEERDACKATLDSVAGFQLPAIKTPSWPLVDGRSQYNPAHAGALAHDFAMFYLDITGLRKSG